MRNLLSSGPTFFTTRLKWVVTHEAFWILTLLGNGAIASGCVGIYLVESGVNPHLHGWLDALWWSVTIVTTVGAGEVTPVTPLGKLIGIALMLSGTVLFSSFTALFAATLLTKDFR